MKNKIFKGLAFAALTGMLATSNFSASAQSKPTKQVKKDSVKASPAKTSKDRKKAEPAQKHPGKKY